MLTQTYKQDLISINIARAFAATSVFYYHQHIGLVLSKHTGITYFFLSDSIGANYAVPLFFLISGYCIHLSNIKYLKADKTLPIKQYFKRRFLRLYPAYIIAVVFSIVVTLITHTLPQPTWQDVFVHIFLLQGLTTAYFNGINVVLWTITIELLLYIIYPLFYFIRVKFSLIHATLFALLISCASIIYFTGPTISSPEYYFVLNIWFAWCCGAYIADKQNVGANDLDKPIYKVLYAFIFIAFCWITFSQIDNNSLISYQLKILIWLGPLVILINNEKWFKQRQQSLLLKVLTAIGLSSYSLYLFHVPLIYIRIFLSDKYLPLNLHFIGVITGFFIIPLITWFCYLYIEKTFMVKRQKIQS